LIGARNWTHVPIGVSDFEIFFPTHR
jgi:hypothetical protein